MKKIFLLLSLALATSFNASALTPKLSPAQQLADIVDEYMFQYILDQDNIATSSQAILDYYEIEATETNLSRVTTLVKDYYSSPEYKMQYKAQTAKIYEKTMTPTELQEWIKFFESPVGISILKNKAYNESLLATIEQLFPEDAEPSPEAQKKMMYSMMKIVDQ